MNVYADSELACVDMLLLGSGTLLLTPVPSGSAMDTCLPARLPALAICKHGNMLILGGHWMHSSCMLSCSDHCESQSGNQDQGCLSPA
jgi:hypothetical protein